MIRTAVVALILVAFSGAPPRAQEPAAMPGALAGRWLGHVTADVGEMPIEVTIAVADGKLSGAVRTYHGVLTITSAERQADGRWKLPFADEDGNAGSLVGSVSGDVLSGDWNYAPRARGTFEVKRSKG